MLFLKFMFSPLFFSLKSIYFAAHWVVGGIRFVMQNTAYDLLTCLCLYRRRLLGVVEGQLVNDLLQLFGIVL